MSKKDNYISVSELNTTIKDILTTNLSQQLKIKGELSNIKYSGNHTYLTLKDDTSSISVTAWNTKFTNLNNGDDVMVIGKLSCFLKAGTYQINATKIERIGIGHLHEMMEENKKNFEEKGYFAKSINNNYFPNKINKIGILTASGGAALHDILYVLDKNAFCGKVYVKNCSVQGVNCPSSVKNGISFFNKLHETTHIDVLIIARGGGSFEDLVGYSSKEIVKSIYKTPIFTISAVGHEVDTMLSDYAANYRAPTPSVAGEIVSSLEKKKKDTLLTSIDRLLITKTQIKNKLLAFQETLKSQTKILKNMDPQSFIYNEINKFSKIKSDFKTTTKNCISKYFNKLEILNMQNELYNPRKTFENGFVAIIDENNNLINTLESYNKIKEQKQKLKIIFVDGEIELLNDNTDFSKSLKNVKKSK